MHFWRSNVPKFTHKKRHFVPIPPIFRSHCMSEHQFPSCYWQSWWTHSPSDQHVRSASCPQLSSRVIEGVKVTPRKMSSVTWILAHLIQQCGIEGRNRINDGILACIGNGHFGYREKKTGKAFVSAEWHEEFERNIGPKMGYLWKPEPWWTMVNRGWKSQPWGADSSPGLMECTPLTS